MKLEFDEQDLTILDKALSQLPYYEVVGLIEKINKQIAEDKGAQHGND